MKKIILTAVLLFLTIPIDAQVNKLSDRQNYKGGSFEAGLASDIGLNTIKKTTPGDIPFYFYTGDNKELYLCPKASLAYYLIDGLSFEPELGINLNFEETTAIILGNISYTFNTEVRTLFPYLKAGYGVTDVQNYTSPGSGLFESLNYKVISFSLGFKFIQSFHRAIKVELNYKRVSGSDGLLYYYDPYGSAVSPEIETTMSILSISFGYSFTF